jgi:L-fuconolactonase
MQIVDAHLHLFDLEQGDYAWLKPHNAPHWPDKSLINKNVKESDLTLAPPFSLGGFVHIEAGFDNQQPWREIAWLEANCQLAFKAVAFIDILLPPERFKQEVKRLLEFSSVVGCRYILEQQALHLLKQTIVLDNLAELARNGLSFDLQMGLEQQDAVACVCQLMQQVPTLKVIINHAGWPPAQHNNQTPESINWRLGLTKLGAFKQCAIKCSGWEMTDRNYLASWPLKVIELCLEAFDIERVMLASNFPLCQFSQPYAALWQAYSAALDKIEANHKPLTKKQRAPLLRNNLLRDNLLRDNLLRDNLLRDNLLRDNLLRDNLLRDNLLRDNLLRDNLLRDNLLRDNLLRDNALLWYKFT